MTSLLDIGPLTESVQVGSSSVTVRGVTPEGFFFLLAKFPMLQQLFGGKARDIGAEMLHTVGPTCMATVLAVCTTNRGQYPDLDSWSADVERAAQVAISLSASDQMRIFDAALRLTFPDGIGPFMAAMGSLANSINRVSGAPSGQGPVTTSSRRSRSGFTKDSPGMRLGPGRRSESSVH